jgi:hypothetical protein
MVYRKLTVKSVTASGDDGNVPSNVLDDSQATRWSCEGIGSWILLDLGESFKIIDVDIAWFKGTERTYKFKLETSLDKTTWDEFFKGESSSDTAASEKYNERDEEGQYVKLTVDGNNENNWAAVTEIWVNGDDITSTEPSPTLTPEPQPQPEPTPTPTAGVDSFGIKKIYADVEKPYVKAMDMDEANNLPLDNVPCNKDQKDHPGTFEKSGKQVPGKFESWLCGRKQIRIVIWSDDHKPWGNCEMTYYTKILSGTTTKKRLMQPYIGGGDHNTDADGACDGNAYKFCIWGNGDTSHRKEQCHEAYCPDVNIIKGNIKGGIIGRWLGFKLVQILHKDQAHVLEIYIDDGCDQDGNLVIQGNENRWRKLSRFVDKVKKKRKGVNVSDWRCTDKEFEDCESCDHGMTDRLDPAFVRTEPYGVTRKSRDWDDVTHRNAAGGVIRTDRHTQFELAFWSVREIAAQPAMT